MSLCSEESATSLNFFTDKAWSSQRIPSVHWALSLLTAMACLSSVPLLSWSLVMNTLGATDAKNSSCASHRRHHCSCCCSLPGWNCACLEKKKNVTRSIPSITLPNVKGSDIQQQLQWTLLPLIQLLSLPGLLSPPPAPLPALASLLPCTPNVSERTENIASLFVF